MKINLYSTHFISSNAERQKEIDFCLINNLKNLYIDKICLFVESTAIENLNIIIESLGPIEKNKLNIILLNKCPSYKNWLDLSKQNNTISIFANADIYFDSTIQNAFKYLDNEKQLICLSRYDCRGDQTIIHPNPRWSQDTWIINSNQIDKINFIDKLDISTGKCRCDNKIAYYFAINSWNIYNPCYDIKSYHCHESEIRNYNQKTPDIFGAIAFVNPTSSNEPSIIDICVMPKKNNNIDKCLLSTFLYE